MIELVPLDDVLARGGYYLDDEERAALHRSIEEGIEDFERGDTVDAFDLIAWLRAHREGRDRQPNPPPSRMGK